MKHYHKSLLIVAAVASLSTASVFADKARVPTLAPPGPSPQLPADAEPANPESCGPEKSIVTRQYSVRAFDYCGKQVKADGVIGFINKKLRPCVKEIIVAEVYSSPDACEDCDTTVSAVQSVDERKRYYGNQEYFEAVVTDLASKSQKIRGQAISKLTSWGYDVTFKSVCFDSEKPTAIFYSN